MNKKHIAVTVIVTVIVVVSVQTVFSNLSKETQVSKQDTFVTGKTELPIQPIQPMQQMEQKPVVVKETTLPDSTIVYSIGEKAEWLGIAAIVHSVYGWNDTGAYPKVPAQGNCFIAIDMAFMNNTKAKKIMVNVNSFSAMDGNGRRYKHPSMVSSPEPDISTVDIYSGDTLRGWLVMEVPLQGSLVLVWDIPVMADAQLRFRIR